MWVLIEDTEAIAYGNQDFLRVLTTTEHYQLVAVTLAPGEQVGDDVHPDADQYVQVVAGTAEVTVGRETATLHAHGAFIVPRGTHHSTRNSGTTPLRLLGFFAPPVHPPQRIEARRPEGEQLATI